MPPPPNAEPTRQRFDLRLAPARSQGPSRRAERATRARRPHDPPRTSRRQRSVAIHRHDLDGLQPWVAKWTRSPKRTYELNAKGSPENRPRTDRRTGRRTSRGADGNDANGIKPGNGPSRRRNRTGLSKRLDGPEWGEEVNATDWRGFASLPHPRSPPTSPGRARRRPRDRPNARLAI